LRFINVVSLLELNGKNGSNCVLVTATVTRHTASTSLYHAPKLHPGPCSSVGIRPRTDRHRDTHTQTDRHTDARDHNTFCIVYDSLKM